jgi:hypothetical protein
VNPSCQLARESRCVSKTVRLQLLQPASGRSSTLKKAKTILARPTSNSEFLVDDDDHTRLAFVRDVTEKISGAVLNPGPWQITATKVN